MATTYTPQTYTAQTGQATNWNVDDKQTAQGQLAGMLKSDSPLMQWSATQGKQQAQKRGLLNSSMGIEASQNAMIQNAAPIAQQDANTFAQSGQFNATNQTNASFNNAQAENAARQFNANSANQFALADKQIEADYGKLAKQQEYNLQSMATGQGYTQANMATQQGYDLSKMSTSQQQDLAKMAAQQGYNLQSMSAQQVNDLQKLAAQQNYNVQNLNIQQQFNERMATMEQEGLDYRQAREIASREAITKLEQQGITNRFDQELALKSSMFNAEQTNMERRQILEQQARMQELGIRINADKQTIPTSFAANISNTTMNGVNQIMSSGLDKTQQQAAIDNLVKYANSQIAWAEKFYGTQIPQITTPAYA